MEHLLAPSILAADFANLERDIQLINASEADWFHLDVMDGVFVPNISFGMPVIKSIATHAYQATGCSPHDCRSGSDTCQRLRS
jgi:ribulose-phosphate 3-epimerase